MNQVEAQQPTQCKPQRPAQWRFMAVLGIFDRPSLSCRAMIAIRKIIVQTRNQTERMLLSPRVGPEIMAQKNEYCYAGFTGRLGHLSLTYSSLRTAHQHALR